MTKKTRHGSAIERARRIWWSEVAQKSRQAMRSRGLLAGDWLDDIAGQRRGHNVPDQLGRLADEMRAAGLGDDTIRAVIIEGVMQIVGTRRQDGGPRAA
jgi:hypothetical protein